MLQRMAGPVIERDREELDQILRNNDVPGVYHRRCARAFEEWLEWKAGRV